MKIANNQDTNKVVYFTQKNMEKTPEGIVLDKLRLYNVCCRRHMLTHVDIE
jgi:DNA-directed RNA polymerase I, II, and III subunit RPABC5